ncbi:methylmalonyl-CoA mutase family protein [Bacillus sp. FJAT-45037]|uniref:methylmalonyl-CoA mutase family protein n=1 Tax=Bacillus sp. FJAT-45037 TaxID=2011007 RepID=UPI0012FD58F7|nr:methylmalonyl-CoA mutase family protein [Bacillus sp. FJAT-45037]
MSHKDLEKFSEFPIPTYDQWREVAERSIKGAPFDKLLRTQLYEGMMTEPMYQLKDVEDVSTLLEQPGKFPFSRGTSHEPKKWAVSQEMSGESPNLANKQAHHDLKRGQDVLHFVLDGKAKGSNKEEDGIPVRTMKDVEVLLDGMDVERHSFYLYTGAYITPALSTVLSTLEGKVLRGLIGSDPLFELATHGKLPTTLVKAYDDLSDAAKWAKEHQEHLRTVLIQSSVYHNGGASATVELACALSTGVEYVDEMMKRGLTADEAGRSIMFSFSIGNQSFVEIAKIRSARRLWAAIMREFGATDEGAKMVIHARTSAFTKASLDPYVNMLRGTSEAFSAAVAGVDSIQVSPFDEPIQPSTPFSRRIARNTSLILSEESHLAATTDPAGGAWYVEHLTDELSKKAWSEFQQIEASGSMSEALDTGLIQEWIDATWEVRLKDVEQRKQTIVGVNQYANLNEQLLHENKHIDHKVKVSDMEQTKELETTPTSFAEWIQAAKEGVDITNLYQAFLKSNDAEPMVEVKKIPTRRLTERYEALREIGKKFSETTGQHAEVTIVGLGPLAKHKPRADFVTGYFRAGGFDVSTPVQGEELEATSLSDVVVICGTDESINEQAMSIIERIKKLSDHSQGRIYVAGKQSEDVRAMLDEAGVHDYIHVKSNHFEQLTELWEWKGGLEDVEAIL